MPRGFSLLLVPHSTVFPSSRLGLSAFTVILGASLSTRSPGSSQEVYEQWGFLTYILRFTTPERVYLFTQSAQSRCSRRVSYLVHKKVAYGLLLHDMRGKYNMPVFKIQEKNELFFSPIQTRVPTEL